MEHLSGLDHRLSGVRPQRDTLVGAATALAGIAALTAVLAAERERLLRDAAGAEVLKEATGSGLGLAIGKGLVEAHGGRIWVEDAAGAAHASHSPFRVRGAACGWPSIHGVREGLGQVPTWAARCSPVRVERATRYCTLDGPGGEIAEPAEPAGTWRSPAFATHRWVWSLHARMPGSRQCQGRAAAGTLPVPSLIAAS